MPMQLAMLGAERSPRFTGTQVAPFEGVVNCPLPSGNAKRNGPCPTISWAVVTENCCVCVTSFERYGSYPCVLILLRK